MLENVRKASLAELEYAATGDKGQQVLRTQQKPVAMVYVLIARSSQRQDMGVELFEGTFSTAAALIVVTARRSGPGQPAGAMMTETGPPPKLC